MSEEDKISGSRLLKAVEAIAISPAEAKKVVQTYFGQSRKKYPDDFDWQHQDRVADKIIDGYARFAAMVGGATALAGVIPGIGTAINLVGGAATDVTICMKLQVDMCMCLAETYGYDLQHEDARYLAFLIAASGTLEKMGATTGVRLASKAGVQLLREYLRGAALVAVKKLFNRLGIVFTRKALEKALPFGVGVATGIIANYVLTRFVGHQAKRWFVLDRRYAPDPTPPEPVSA
jgi:hypothetical protein